MHKRIVLLLSFIILAFLCIYLFLNENRKKIEQMRNTTPDSISINQERADLFTKTNHPDKTITETVPIYEDINELIHFEIEFANNETFEEIRNTYSAVDFKSEFEAGNVERYGFYLEKFHLLLEGKAKFIVSDAVDQTFPDEERQFYLSEYKELAAYSTGQDFVPENYLYYFFDMSGDSIPELCVTPKDYAKRFTYIFQYKEETDEFLLWHELDSIYYTLIGTKKVAYINHGLASGFYHVFYQLDEEGYVVNDISFHLISERKTGEEVVLYMVGIPEDFGMNGNQEFMAPYMISGKSGTYYRVTKEQYELLTNGFFEASEEAEKNLEEVTYTYQELLELLEEK